MKKEAWSPSYLNERIDAYLAELPTKEGFYYKRKYKEFNAGDPKPAAIADEKEKWKCYGQQLICIQGIMK